MIPDANIEKNKCPQVSVIIPIYNAEGTLVRAIESLTSQTMSNFEAICINDGSTDNSLCVLKTLVNDDARFRIVDKENAGYGAACNQGLGIATGEWISILEPDDWIDPCMFEQMLAYRNTFDCNVDIIKTPYWRVYEDSTSKDPGYAIRKFACTYKGKVHPTHQPFCLADAPDLFSHHPSIWSALYSKTYLDEKNIRFPEHPGSGWADNRFLADSLIQTDAIIYLDKAFYNYVADSADDEASFAKANPTLPLARWEEMQDVLDREGVSDPKILSAHIKRGFRYLSDVAATTDIEDPKINEAIKHMFTRMDVTLVMNDSSISPALRRIFAKMQRVPADDINDFTHKTYLIKEGLHRLRTNGIKATLSDMKRYRG